MSDVRKTFEVEVVLDLDGHSLDEVREDVDAELDGLLRSLRADMECWLDEAVA